MPFFEDTTAVAETAPHCYEATIDPSWWVLRAPHGGYLASIILRALMLAAADPQRTPRSFTTHFIAPPKPGPISIATSLDRRGRSLSSLSAHVTQDDRLVATALASFSSPWTSIDFTDHAPPAVPSVDDAFPVPTEGEHIPPFLSHFDMRWAIGDPPFSGSKHARVGGWIRMREPQVPGHVLVATYMDAWAPAVFPTMTEPVAAPTIDLTIHFRAPLPPPGSRPDDFYLGVFWSTTAREGFFEEDGELWSADGTLLAQSRQLALLLPRGARSG
jgi:acyl-CoA thioesterase